ncbi:MAG: TRAP transporter small permease subunit [Candidatus Rokuibacteriota bacterium]
MGILRAVTRGIDTLNEWMGRTMRGLTLLMVAVVTYDVVMRYVFRQSFVFVQELEWHLFAVLFLLTAGYAHLKGDHVRVDIFYARMSTRTRARIDLVCTFLFLFPTCFLMISTSIPFVRASLAVLEGSPDPGGLPGRYVLKMVIPLGFLLLGLQGVSEAVKNVDRLRGEEARG